MKELEEVNCEIHNVIEIQHAFSYRSSNGNGDQDWSTNASQPYSSIDSPRGGFLSGAKYAWLNYDSHIIIFNARTGESISSWTFQGKIACVCQFPAQPGELPLLLVGLDNGATKIKDSIGLVCVFDCASSRVLRAIKMPVGVEQVCIVSGGAKWEEFNEKRPNNFLMQMDGIACVVLRNLHHLMIDLQRSTWEIPDDLSFIMDETNPADIEFITSRDSLHRNQLDNSKHMVCNLMNQRIEKHIGFNREEFESTGFLDERLTNTIISSTKIGCLISGCLGRVIIWQNDDSVGSISLPVDETMIVTHMALLEPADDPRPFYYLWVVFQDELSKVPPLLRMYALLFERKYFDKGTNLYFNLEADPSLKFEFELDADDRVLNLSPIERENNPDQMELESKRGEESLLLIASTGRTLLFDLNQWYKEQMPRTVSECKNPNSILASYDIEARSTNIANNEIVSCTYIPRTLQEFPNNRLSSSEELFYPNSLALEWVELSLSKLMFWLTRGVQAELLHEMAIAGPILLTEPSEMFHKCLSVGLVPFNTEVSFSSDHNVQRDMLLSLCLEQHWTNFLIRCAKEWSDGSAAFMYPSFLKWGIERAASIKMIADDLCVPLFDQSGNNVGETELKTLRFCYQQMECLSNVVSKLPMETNSLVKQRRALKRVSIFFQVLLWFYDAGLLPESQDMNSIAATKIPYPYEKLYRLYKEKRESAASDKQSDQIEEVLFIDELIARECPALSSQWKRESGDTTANGYYPPPSLQSLLRCFLTDCEQGEADKLECKHEITIYLLMDLALLLQGSYPGVDQLVKYPSSFKMSSSIIKLTQAFWLLDHEDYHGFLDLMTGQLISDSDVKDWQHKLVLRTLIKNNQHKLALMYLRIRKPPLSSVQDQSTLIGLSVEHGLVQSAFHHRPQTYYAQLLLCFFQSCKAYNRLTDVLHLALDTEEEEMFDKFLEQSKSEDVRLLYYLQRCRYMEANSGNFAAARFNATGAKNDHMDMLNAYNATLPNIMKKFSMSMSKPTSETGMEPRYPRPMTFNRNCQRGTSVYETVIKKAKETFLREDKTVIPFITAPCTTLKPNDEQIDANCIMSPKVMPAHRKRTLDEVQGDDDSEIKTPEKIKRRKLLDVGDTALSAAFSTPLVKRKVSRGNTRIETPHSILKIRQLIRNSTSPSLGPVQSEVTDSGSAAIEKAKKINRQIRFNTSQLKNTTNDETRDEDSSVGTRASDKNEETFFSSLEADKSLMESAILSEGSITCKNICAPRPRPSIGRSHLQTPIASFQDSQRKSLRNSRLEVPSLLDAVVSTPSRRSISRLSASIYSPAVLSPNSSFDIGSPLRRSSMLPSQLAATCNSMNVSTGYAKSPEKPREEEAMNIDEEEEEKEPEEEEAILDASSSIQMTSPIISKSKYLKFNDANAASQYKNGGISKDQEEEEMNVSYTEDKEDADDDDEFESFSNTFENTSAQSENRERRSWSLKSRDPVENEAQQRYLDDLKNDGQFDITDDESNCAEDMVLALEETTEVIRTVSRTTQVCKRNEYDASNITDDESDASVSGDATQHAEDHPENNNSMSEAADKALPGAQRVESKEEPEEEALNDSIASRMTRSRRASSITKEIRPSTVGSPSKAVPKPPARSRRASSLMKEVLIASIAGADEVIKRTGSSGSDDSPVTSSPSKSRGRRASILAKDVSVVEDQPEEDAGLSTPKKTRGRRASSVAKDISLAEDHAEEDAGMSTPKRTRGRRASSIAKDVSPVGRQAEEVSPSTPKKTRGARRTSLIAKSGSLGEEEREEESLGVATPKKTRNRRASSVAKDVHPVSEEAEEKLSIVSTPKKTRGKRASSVAKDVHPVEEEGEDDFSGATSPPRRTRGRKASSKDAHPLEEQEETKVPARRNTRRAASVQKEVPESPKFTRTSSSSSIALEHEEEKSETKSSKVRAAGNRSLRSDEEKSTVKSSSRRRGSSVPKETVDTVRTRRASSVAKETIPEESFDPPLDVSRGRHAVVTVNSPAGNTRNRRSSIQSIPEELEEILSVPLKDRMSSASKKRQTTQAPKQRRAASVEIPQEDVVKRTRSSRGKGILKETIVEEEGTEVEVEEDPKASNVKRATRRKDASMDSGAQETTEATPKPRKAGKKASTKQDSGEQFSFSQPDKTKDPPSDEKAIREVPNYVFSPPHTRSKNVAPDNRD